ncbi:MAG TPA: glycosyltransferase [Anaerolineae bacterium]|nr:glycosyltransferase [Anaerolineae bacterium]
MILIASLYTFAATALALYGVYVLVLIFQYLRYRNRPVAEGVRLSAEGRVDLPVVTVQLPMYNERYVAARSIDAVAALDWPRDRLQIQVLDDSTDDTTEIARVRSEAHRQAGIDLTLIHRSNRAGYKAGALAHGLRSARGEYVAIFDADFVPAPDFLRRLLPYFERSPSIGFVQARWEHLNYPRSALARALAIAVDGHFVVEQFARYRSGWPMIFNGSAGIWRRACIDLSGGWQGDTLCEDMDLSYRAALAGWQCVFAPEVAVPQEEPVSIGAVKLQHARWAQGGAQCLRKHAGALLTARRWSPLQKIAGLSYLAGYTAHLLIVLIVLLWLPLALDGNTLKHLPLTFLGLSGLALPIEYALAQWALHRRDGSWLRRLAHLPLLLIIGFGVAFNNALAVLAGLFRRGGEFRRTPKVARDAVALDSYRSDAAALAVLEIGLAVYALVTAGVMWAAGNTPTAAFLLIYVGGFGAVGFGSLIEGLRAQAVLRPARLSHADNIVHYE